MDAAKREARLKQWHESGLKLAKFARKVGISPNMLKQWDKETGIKKGAEKKSMPAEVSGMDAKGNMKGMEVVKIADLKVKSPESQASGIHLNIRGVTIYLVDPKKGGWSHASRQAAVCSRSIFRSWSESAKTLVTGR